MKSFKITAAIGILLLIIFTAGCSPEDAKNPKYAEYYHGTDGVYMEIETSSLPSRLYYYYGGTDEENTFDVAVNLHNRGASMTKGTVYIAGYDPSIISVEGVELEKSYGLGDCNFNFHQLDSFFLSGGCGDIFDGWYDTGNGQWKLNLKDVVSNIGELTGKWDETLFDFDITLTNNGIEEFAGGMNWGELNLDMLGRGELSIILAQAVHDFSKYGKPYFLQGDIYDYPGGESMYENFEVTIKDWPAHGLDKMEQTFMIKNCYVYSTYASPMVCIDPNPYSGQEKVCIPQTVSLSSQGAPVAVTRIEQESTRQKIFFTIHVQDLGNGQVYSLFSLDACNPYYGERVNPADKDIVEIAFVSVGDQRLDCNTHRLRLNNGYGVFTCTYDVEYKEATSAYKTPLYIHLLYGYGDYINRYVTIKRV